MAALLLCLLTSVDSMRVPIVCCTIESLKERFESVWSETAIPKTWRHYVKNVFFTDRISLLVSSATHGPAWRAKLVLYSGYNLDFRCND